MMCITPQGVISIFFFCLDYRGCNGRRGWGGSELLGKDSTTDLYTQSKYSVNFYYSLSSSSEPPVRHLSDNVASLLAQLKKSRYGLSHPLLLNSC